jgi:hypothetical protein
MVVKNRTTPENRAFWDHVEKIAQQVRLRRELKQVLMPSRKT